uniref:Vasoactive intestinal polypeptide receptor-like n=1 Tax=Callorhinchus milii TaxID=7868 RepID=A0A4W3HU32_CALMI
MQADCELLLEFQEGAERCRAMDIATNMSAWDNVSCWPASAIGEIVVLPCPRFPSLFTRTTGERDLNVLHLRDRGNISRRCTSEGWTDLFTSYSAACGYNPNNTEPDVKVTCICVGHEPLVPALVTIAVCCSGLGPRKLHCTRNYIHINLFLSFILKAVSVFVKDAILFGSETDQCSPSTTSCKVAIAFFHFSVTANFFWLLAEAVYLHTLMAVSFFIDNEHFGSYFAIAWGKGAPALITLTWSLVMLHYDDVGGDPARLRLRSSSRRAFSSRRRLARSTLFLIPLFGVNYMVFVFVPHHLNSYVQLVFDLTLGSFQGSIVATLYCFLNGEVRYRASWLAGGSNAVSSGICRPRPGMACPPRRAPRRAPSSRWWPATAPPSGPTIRRPVPASSSTGASQPARERERERAIIWVWVKR